MIDWKSEFYEKDKYLKSLYPEVSAYEFYRDLFPVGSTQLKNETKNGKGNIIACRFSEDKKHMRHMNIGNDLSEKEMNYFLNYNGSFVSPVSYFGKTRRKENADKMFAMVIDIDLVTLDKLENQIAQLEAGLYNPKPTYIVNSSKGVHLYYLLKEPFKFDSKQYDFNIKAKALTEFKDYMINYLWTGLTSEDDHKDGANIWQIFRAVGSRTKFDDGSIVSAYRMSDKKWDIFELRDFYVKAKNLNSIDLSVLISEKKCTKEEYDKKIEYLREVAPDWVAENIDHTKPKKTKHWTLCSTAMYDKWINHYINEAVEGGRYYYILTLFSNAYRCGIPLSQAYEDAKALLPYLNSLTKEKEPFTINDINDAYRYAYKIENRDAMFGFNAITTSKKTKIKLVPAKRNGRTQQQHLERARAVQNIDYPNGEWRGRKPKKDIVQNWKKEHPEGKKIDCSRDTGIDKKTVYKWWNV